MDEKWEGLDKAFNTVCSERAAGRQELREGSKPSHEEERARKLDTLKEQVRAGIYKPDIKDIARLLTSALNHGA